MQYSDKELYEMIYITTRYMFPLIQIVGQIMQIYTGLNICTKLLQFHYFVDVGCLYKHVCLKRQFCLIARFDLP